MNRRKWIGLAAAFGFFATLLGGTACVSATTDDTADSRKLRVGQSWQYDGGLRVTLLAVRDDSRCPLNASCAWSGDAKIVLLVKVGNQPERKVVLHTDLKPQRAVISAQKPGTIGIPKSYVISVGRLTPLPMAGKPTLQSDYRLKLHITVAQ